MITSGLEVGGSEKQFTQLALGLRARGCRITVVSLQRGGWYEASLRAAGCEVQEIPLKQWATPWRLWALRRAIKATNPDIVHTQAFRANLWGRLAALSTGVVVIASIRATYAYLPRAYLPLERVLSFWTNRIVTPAKASSEYLVTVVGIPRGRVVTIPNGVDTAVFNPNVSGSHFRASWGGSAAFIVLAPGRLVHQKNHASLIRACALASVTVPHLVLVLAGRGPLLDKLKEAAARYQVCVLFAGEVPQPDMPAAFAAADVVCLTSNFEGAPNVVLEAMACGRPVIATGVDGTRDLIRDGVEGFLTDPGDCHAMAAAIERTAASVSLRKEMGEAGSIRARQDYTIEANIEGHLRVYRASRRGRPQLRHLRRMALCRRLHRMSQSPPNDD